MMLLIYPLTNQYHIQCEMFMIVTIYIMLLDKVLIQNNDYLLEERRKVKNKFLTNASEKILEDLLTYV